MGGCLDSHIIINVNQLGVNSTHQTPQSTPVIAHVSHVKPVSYAEPVVKIPFALLVLWLLTPFNCR